MTRDMLRNCMASFEAADVVVDQQPWPIDVQADVGLPPGENRMSEEQARLDLRAASALPQLRAPCFSPSAMISNATSAGRSTRMLLE